MQRNTKQREAIKDVLLNTRRPLRMSEVHELATRQVPGIGIATVYRTVKALSANGWLEVVEMPGETPRYECAGKDHHHHFRCNSCERVYNLEGCLGGMEALLPSGFRLESHELVLTGTCNTCVRS